jgi:F-type H+-transporting ATPase subunit c
MTLLAIALLTPMMAFAGGELVDAYTNIGVAIGAGIAIGVGALGGALGQGRAVGAALEGIGRNPGSADKIFVPMIIGLALIESLVIYALLIAFILVGKIG